MLPYRITAASEKNLLPILISVPHCGTAFPAELKDLYSDELISAPDDTDWFVDQLYDFAPVIGMTMISAVYSRWVIDLNRHPESKPLYTDGRIITGLCPTTDFLGNLIYEDARTEVNSDDVESRLRLYYWPYHQQIESHLQNLKKKFGAVLLWDCHSIRQIVPTIQKEKFPDLILGSADSSSASSTLIEKTLCSLKNSKYSVQHNHPFKGGFITRHYGKPDANVHALQLEMSKVNYMDDTERKYDKARAEKMRELLRSTLLTLAESVSS